MKLDLDNREVFEVELTVDQVRGEELNELEDLLTAMDNAQGYVFAGEGAVSYVVIKIIK